MPPGLSSHEQLIQLRKRARRRLVGAIALVLIATTVLWNVVGHVPDQKLKPQSINIVELNSSAPVAEQSAKAASQAAAAVGAVAAATGVAQTDLPAALPEESKQAAAPAAPVVSPVATKPEPVAPSAKLEVKQPESVKQAETPKPKARAEDKPKAKKADPAAILEGRMGSEEAPKPKAEKKTDESVKPGNGKVMIQLAALSDPDKVEALRSKLDGIAGMSAHFSKVQTSKGEVTRVRVGPFSSASEAQSVLSRLAKAGITGIVVSH
ncbi:SPOR domain-containing protein [Crenobacter sp. SG2305]|uniref:SPOR domain-containing protein n=1 Tax=Crenobacter oryzisoli TaxID=3056844 RepID=UPI0025AA3BFA|nr:SPOR domain-containing protein [Crenobacter sp. SG2305]MDN0082905.1 SPOR domain-containing protein [Crenobacter sp. SG2305]